MTQSNPYYCSKIINGLYVEKVSSGKIRVSACCINSPGEPQDTVNFATDPHLDTQRKLMMAQQPVPGCEICYRSEKETQYSMRIVANKLWPKDSLPDQVIIKNLDYNVDPICNAKCIQCSSYYSSSWAAENQRFNVNHIEIRTNSTTKLNNLSHTIDLTTVKKIYFNGGEPMLSDEPRIIMQRLKDMSRLSEVTIQFNTNGSILPSNNLIELWSECRAVNVMFSIDGTGSAFEYIRNPLKWDQIEKVVEQFGNLTLPNYSINIADTAGIHNIDTIEKTYQWFLAKSRNWKFQQDFRVHPCHGLLDISGAESELKKYWLEQLTHQAPQKWHTLLQNRIQTSSTLNNWRDWLKTIDQRRNLNWQNSLPELAMACEKSLA
jgi:molybdenum cofactor biosynthesis enzyme MoaA